MNQPTALRPKTAARRPRRLGLRGQLMLFLCAMCLLLLELLFLLTAGMLQPRYNKHIHNRLTAQLDSFVGLMDDAIAGGTVLSRREMGLLMTNREFWDGVVNQAVRDGRLSFADFCVDVSDTTLRHVVYSENLYPCLLHENTSAGFGIWKESSRDSAEVIQLRQECLNSGEVYKIIETASGSRQMVVGRTTADGAYVVLISTNLAQVGEAAVVLRHLIPTVSVLLLAVAVAAAWLFSRWFTRPLVRLSAASRRMTQGDYTVRVEEPARTDELGALARDFNRMAGAVQQAAQLQRDLLANVSHDLRTPLTLIKGYAETVRDLTGEDKQKRDEQMNIVIDETDRLSQLVSSVLELSKVSSGAETCRRVRFEMAQLCEEVAERYEAVCAQNGWTLRLELPPDTALPVDADPAMIERALHNLLGNAMNHIGPDGVFVLRAKPVPGGCRIEVEDHGPGIPAEELPYIFDRYYRSRSDAGKAGTGLGLSITKAIFRQHGFRFGVESTVGKGSLFWFVMTGPQNTGPAAGGESS